MPLIISKNNILTISTSTKYTHVTLLGKDIGKFLKTLLSTTELPTGVVTVKGSTKISGRHINFYLLEELQMIKYHRDKFKHKHQ